MRMDTPAYHVYLRLIAYGVGIASTLLIASTIGWDLIHHYYTRYPFGEAQVEFVLAVLLITFLVGMMAWEIRIFAASNE